MYSGSMYGAGPVFFSVMGYIIGNTRNSRLEINPKILADTIGTTPEAIQEVLDKMLAPDPKSRNKEHEGRKLIQEGEFQYFVTGWCKYQAIRNEDQRKESNRIAQANSRARKAGKPLPNPKSKKIRPLTQEEQDDELAAAAEAQEAMKRLREAEEEHREAMVVLNQVQEGHQVADENQTAAAG